MSKKQILVPLWRPVGAALLMAALAILIGLAVILEGKQSLMSPAYRPLRLLPYGFWGTLYLVPGTVAATLLAFGNRRNAFVPLLFLAAFEAFWTAIILIYGVKHPAALTGTALFGIFAGSTLLSAFTAADLP